MRFLSAMRRKRGWLVLSLGAGLALAALTIVSCSSVQRSVVAPPMIEGASFVGNRTCYDCHTNISRGFISSPHARVQIEGAKMADQIGCEACHGPASKHIAVGGGRGKFIINPGRDPAACLACHLQQHAEFNLPQRHPVLEGRMNCVQCHDPHGLDIMKAAGGTGLAMARLNESCSECHREQAKLHVFEHEALREGCTACHVPHGSVNAKMLVERDSNLCLKCHAQTRGTGGALVIGTVPHGGYVSRGACWSAGCHPAVHGSSVSPHLHY